MSEAKRIDDQIYLKEDRFSKPKELFKFVGKMIEESIPKDGGSILDAGCATGEFLYYLCECFPDAILSGFDISEVMIEHAKTQNGKVNFWSGNILDKQAFGHERFNIVTNIGVVGFFDEDELIVALSNLISAVSDGGILLIHSGFNLHPIDVIMKYRRVCDDTAVLWERGWNTFSRKSVEIALNAFDYELEWSWHPWEMPFAINKREDPMRAWTIETEDNPFQRINGANQFIHTEVLKVKVNRKVS